MSDKRQAGKAAAVTPRVRRTAAGGGLSLYIRTECGERIGK